MSKRRVKIIEKTGTQIQQLLTSSDPWETETCSRENCMVCQSSKDGYSRCKETNLLYMNTCRICKSLGKTQVYIGETARSGYRRSIEHLGDLTSKKDESDMYAQIKNTIRN